MSDGNGTARDFKGNHLVLASASRSRRELLEAAGVDFEVIPAEVDEPAIRAVFTRQNEGDEGFDPADIATLLACAKAETVSKAHHQSVVIGADQILSLDGEIFDKPADLHEAAQRLLKLRGQTHQLHSGVAIAVNGQTEWSICQTAYMTMRNFSNAFVGRHLAKVGDIACTSVGAYQLEARGVQLFDKIDGDYFTILGLPLLPLLDQLRQRGFLE